MYNGIFMSSNIISQFQQWYSENSVISGAVTFLVVGIFLFALIFSIIDD